MKPKFFQFELPNEMKKLLIRADEIESINKFDTDLSELTGRPDDMPYLIEIHTKLEISGKNRLVSCFPDRASRDKVFNKINPFIGHL
ncbi:MAG: hypothetical protein ACJ75J_06590 [Cytophagaceae bacterium]